MYRGTCTDFNNATEVGYYQVGSSSYIPGCPNGAYRYGTLFVVGNTFIIQIYFPDTYGKIYKRNKYEENWRDWHEFDGTQIL